MIRFRGLPLAAALLLGFGCADTPTTPIDVPVDLPLDGDAGDVPVEDDAPPPDDARPDGDASCTPTGPEICNELDDDCNGTTDEGFDLATDPENCGACGTLCAAAANAAAVCVGGECGLACEAGWTDANRSPVDGCEYACTAAAAAESATDGTCEDALDNDCDTRTDATDPDCSACVPEFCNLADDDCDGLTDEDIDTDFDPLNCGACGTVCPARAHAFPACMLGDCDITCEAGWSNINGELADGCETTCVLDPDPSEIACNGVDNDCDGRTDEDYVTYECGVGLCVRDSVCNHGMPVCEPGRPPAPRDLTCDGFDDDCDGETDEEGDCGCTTAADCDDGNPCTSDVCGTDLRCQITPLANDSSCPAGICCGGLCVDSRTDPSHCGTCATSCGPGSACGGGACACTGALLNCDGNWGNGCEINGASDPANCGACASSCGLHGTCSSGSCGCVAPYLNCNGGWGDGCEVEPAVDPANCGSCGNSCGTNSTCGAGACSCSAPYLNCDASWASGCEVNPASDPANCGRCGNSCGTRATCSSGSCACSSPYLDCNASWADGCEVNPTSDSSNCGSCGNRCGSNAYCASSTCACNTGYGNCSGGWADGCETSLTSLANCGSCGRLCDLANASESCSSGTCSIVSCNTGWGDCGGGASDGCETSLTTLANCGRCGTACAPAHATGASCATGSCSWSGCETNWGNCNGVTADGCETSLTSLTNCGACSRTCDLANASESCSTGTCTLGSCSTGYGNCNGNPSDGCETNMRLSTSCGTACTGLSDCTALPYISSGSCNASGGCVIGGCASGRAECNDVVSDGCERNLNDNAGSCGSGYLGTISGDTTSGTGPLTATSWGENWYYFQLREDDSGLGFPYISARIFLDVPPGVDYDLYVHGGGSCSSCVISSSGGLQGVDETVYLSWDDSWGTDDDRYVYVEVRWFSGSTLDCGGWTLTINGNWADSTRDC